MGCRLVITASGYTRSYFGDAAFYCKPSQPDTIFNAVKKAMASTDSDGLQKKILDNYTWEKTAEQTLAVYKKYI